METLRNMQFCAVVMLGLLTMALAVLPQRVARQRVADHARWLMAFGTTILGIQFLLQYTLRLREMGVTQAVMLNLVFFIPASTLFTTSVLYMQRQGRVRRYEWLVGIVTWLVTVVMLGVAAAIDGVPLLSESRELRIAELAGSVLYAIMQGYYAWLTLGELHRMRRAIEEYYDREKYDLLHWMERSVWLITLMALMVPPLIFSTGWLTRVLAFVFIISSFYLVICFICYIVSSDQPLVTTAEEVQHEAASVKSKAFSEERLAHVAEAVERWTQDGSHLRQELNIQTVADELHLSRTLLSAWLKTTEWEVFSAWLTHLRIEDAKRLMRQHPDWSNDAVALQCGFSSRSYFQKKFKELTGMTPGEFLTN